MTPSNHPQGPARPASLRALNVSLVVLSAAALLLLYGLIARLLFPNVDPIREENPGRFVGDVLQVQVLNGCGVSGLAASVTAYLRRQGFDVVEVGDRGLDQEQTILYDRIGDREAATKIANALGLDAERVVQEIRPEEFLDATVVIGRDYATLKPFLE
jgi:hypothetical protein